MTEQAANTLEERLREAISVVHDIQWQHEQIKSNVYEKERFEKDSVMWKNYDRMNKDHETNIKDLTERFNKMINIEIIG